MRTLAVLLLALALPAWPAARAADLVQEGAYLARAGDCVACHTQPGGKPFAGGLKLATPIGQIYSTNITPDRQTGIGAYGRDDFARALRQGIALDGHTLYPAMPYPAYARLTDADVDALYAYFMQSVAPVHAVNRPVDIPWPLSMRWPLSIWRLLFAPAARPFAAPAGADPVLARGAYLVDGLGHCGSCHTPRAITMQEKASTAGDGPAFLAGGAPVDDWVPVSLRSDTSPGLAGWSEAEIVQYLKTGRTRQSAVFGAMSDVVVHSTQYLSEADLHAIAVYLKSLGGAPGRPPFKVDPATARALQAGDDAGPGAALYVDNCNACHRSDGMGYERIFPPLAGNSAANAADPSSVIHVILSGSTLPGVADAPSAVTMAPYAWRLDDGQVAALATFVRQSWGNKGGAVTADEVEKVRAAASPAEKARWQAAMPERDGP